MRFGRDETEPGRIDGKGVGRNGMVVVGGAEPNDLDCSS